MTGLLKANFPARIAFAMTSNVDSRTILDTAGAEDLMGRGDMLFQPCDKPHPVGLQGVFVSDREIDALADHWRAQGAAPTTMTFRAEPKAKVVEGPPSEAVAILRDGYRRICSGMLARRMGITGSEAAKVLRQMAAAGYLEAPTPDGWYRVIR